MKSAFITVEGVDGSGKTTQVRLLREYLDQEGVPYVFVREPGGTRVGEQIRPIILSPDNPEMTPETEALLYAAARAQLVREVILPALWSDKTVLCDRFVDSSLCYQGHGAGLDLEFVREINRVASAGLRPELTILFDLPPEEGERRRGNPGDRIERRDPSYHQRVRQCYLDLARVEPHRITVIDARQTVEEIHRQVRDLVRRALGI